MTLMELILIFLLQFEGISADHTLLFYSPGDDATLPCGDVSRSTVRWLYKRDPSQIFDLVQNGNVVKNSARASRMSLDAKSSLVINTITADDAGLYSCLQRDTSVMNVYLSIMTILPSPPNADPKRDGRVTLECTLLRYRDLGCRGNSIHWLDETGNVLLGDGVGYEFIGQTGCVSVLTVKHQCGYNRTYTCQRTGERRVVEIKADYTPIFKEWTCDYQSCKSDTDWSLWDYVMLTLRIAGLLLMTVIVVLLIKGRGNKASPAQNRVCDDDKVNYENVEATSAF